MLICTRDGGEESSNRRVLLTETNAEATAAAAARLRQSVMANRQGKARQGRELGRRLDV